MLHRDHPVPDPALRAPGRGARDPRTHQSLTHSALSPTQWRGGSFQLDEPDEQACATARTRRAHSRWRRPMIQSVKVKNLSLSKDNVRKSNRDTDLASLAANIAAQGLLQNLVVTPLKKAGHFTVKAGG